MKRTTHRSIKGTKLYAVRNSRGQFAAIQTYKAAHAAEIRNRAYATQLKCFDGLKFERGIMPTDIDAFVEFNGKEFFFVEAKYRTSSVAAGQQLALERLCDTCQRGGADTFLIIATHKSSGDIDFAALPVARYRFRGRWKHPGKTITLREFIDGFRRE